MVRNNMTLIRCPCRKCGLRQWIDPDSGQLEEHLLRRGFMLGFDEEPAANVGHEEEADIGREDEESPEHGVHHEEGEADEGDDDAGGDGGGDAERKRTPLTGPAGPSCSRASPEGHGQRQTRSWRKWRDSNVASLRSPVEKRKDLFNVRGALKSPTTEERRRNIRAFGKLGRVPRAGKEASENRRCWEYGKRGPFSGTCRTGRSSTRPSPRCHAHHKERYRKPTWHSDEHAERTKDGPKARTDLKLLGLKKELQYPTDSDDDDEQTETTQGHHKRAKKNEVVVLKPACFTPSEEELERFFECLLGVSSSRLLGEDKQISGRGKKRFSGMKSHDRHVLMTQILPVAMRGIMDDHVRETLFGLRNFFDVISRKSIGVAAQQLQEEIVEILCELEIYFPPAFFDIMVHLLVHVVDDIIHLGPTFLHNMMPFKG
ncbi:hypothetical protein QYE76_020250 [Lolium multiflorum]|uniref:DUF4218 domain-containing protein n=1 Tax=Lolium multiflorum TaxID=4521 RepID=A0AAD8VS08_LOLMU|nr:hypothetical protein QYE76_020250 [Lolium multiflorum]